MDVVEAGLRQRVEDLMRDHQRPAVGREGQAADVVRRQRPDQIDGSPFDIDDRQLAAEGIGDDQLGTIGDQRQLARAKRQVERAENRKRGGEIGQAPFCQPDERQPARPARGHDTERTIRRHDDAEPGRG